jgi:hypothetical protein
MALYEAAVYTWGALAVLAVLTLTPPVGSRSSSSVD